MTRTWKRCACTGRVVPEGGGGLARPSRLPDSQDTAACRLPNCGNPPAVPQRRWRVHVYQPRWVMEDPFQRHRCQCDVNPRHSSSVRTGQPRFSARDPGAGQGTGTPPRAVLAGTGYRGTDQCVSNAIIVYQKHRDCVIDVCRYRTGYLDQLGNRCSWRFRMLFNIGYRQWTSPQTSITHCPVEWPDSGRESAVCAFF